MKNKILLAFFIALTAVMLALCVSAEVSISYDLSTVDTTAGEAYRVTATIYDTATDFRGLTNTITFDYNTIIPVHKTKGTVVDIATSTDSKLPLNRYSYYSESEGDDVNASWASVLWTANGVASTLEYDIYITPDDAPANGEMFFDMTFMLADGKTVDDFTADTFRIDYIHYVGGSYDYFYGNADTSKNNIILTNNVVPEATVITIPVLAGDKIYLQDGTVATAEAAGDYEVPATVGYVAVNTGKTSQVTYYVNGTSATAVHTNGIVSTEGNDLRGPDETYNDEDRSGLRFKMNHNPQSRKVEGHEVTEVGVLMTVESNKVIAGIGQETIDDLKLADVGTYVKKGYALGDGYDRAFNTEDDEKWIISAVMYNITLNEANVQVNIVCRPFYKVGETYIYGETMKGTLYDTAKEIKDGGYLGCSDAMKNYIDEILKLVDGEETPIVEEEVIIDISGLYGV